MSEESKSEELRLPEELAALEALLAAKPLAAAGIDRDQLMYRAGWAACEAALMQPRPSAGGRLEVPQAPVAVETYPPAEPGAARVRRTVLWAAGSAALAASLTVMATLGWVGAVKRLDQMERAGGGTPRLAEGGGLPQTLAEVKSLTARDVSAAEVERLLDSSGRHDRLTLAGPWFAMKQRGFDGSTSDAALRTDRATATTDGAPPSAKTARELWKEMNPNETTTPTPVWPWGRPLSGDSI
jgi:hypothetical protein